MHVELIPAGALVLDATQLLYDLQQVNRLGQRIAGCLNPHEIAHTLTDALITEFDCAFARIWLTDRDQKGLSLVASSGLYTHINGSFAYVPMGAYKVGKIAENHVPFLSNQLAEEPWVKDREWAIANNIQGFAGYPLMAREQVLGVLATFSHAPLASEFLEVLQVICLTATIALDAALQHQQQQPAIAQSINLSLSDQLLKVLGSNQLMLVGTERPINISLEHLILRTVEQLHKAQIYYCRLTYGQDALTLEILVAAQPSRDKLIASFLEPLHTCIKAMGGDLTAKPGKQKKVLEMILHLPYHAQPIQPSRAKQILSEREHQVMTLLAHGYRDRDIAQELHISESTVKFHVNNTLTKLNAKNRYQAVYEATSREWL